MDLQHKKALYDSISKQIEDEIAESRGFIFNIALPFLIFFILSIFLLGISHSLLELFLEKFHFFDALAKHKMDGNAYSNIGSLFLSFFLSILFRNKILMKKRNRIKKNQEIREDIKRRHLNQR